MPLLTNNYFFFEIQGCPMYQRVLNDKMLMTHCIMPAICDLTDLISLSRTCVSIRLMCYAPDQPLYYFRLICRSFILDNDAVEACAKLDDFCCFKYAFDILLQQQQQQQQDMFSLLAGLASLGHTKAISYVGSCCPGVFDKKVFNCMARSMLLHQHFVAFMRYLLPMRISLFTSAELRVAIEAGNVECMVAVANKCEDIILPYEKLTYLCKSPTATPEMLNKLLFPDLAITVTEKFYLLLGMYITPSSFYNVTVPKLATAGVNIEAVYLNLLIRHDCERMADVAHTLVENGDVTLGDLPPFLRELKKYPLTTKDQYPPQFKHRPLEYVAYIRSYARKQNNGGPLFGFNCGTERARKAVASCILLWDEEE